MKHKITLLLLLLAGIASAQDTIISFKGKRLPATIVSKDGDSIRYKRTDYRESETYAIDKKSVWEIKNANGSIETFFTEAEKSRSLDDIKAHLVDMIGKYACDEDSDRKRFVATFEGDHIRLAHAKNGKVFWNGYIYDFARVYAFHPVSERGKTDAYINIYVDWRPKPKRNKWEKIKLIMKANGRQEAHEIMRSFQYLNRLLMDKNSTHPLK